jgi:hypothetical protein
MEILGHVAAVNPPDWQVVAGVIRDIVWDCRYRGGFDPQDVRDVDVAFFDPADLTPGRDAQVEAMLCQRRPDVPWEAKNQAAVHLWYPRRFGTDVPAFACTSDAISTFPEYAVCVGVQLTVGGDMAICAPHGLDDLLDGVWRRNPARVTRQEYARRLARKAPSRRWPAVRVVA